MNTRETSWTRCLLVLAVVQGIAGDVLLRGGPWGINILLWSGLGVLGLFVVSRRCGIGISRAAWGWLAGAVGCAALVGGRGSPELALLSLAAGVGCLVLAAWTARGGSPATAGLIAYALEAAATAIQSMLGGFLALVLRPGRSSSGLSGEVKRPRMGLRIALGGVVAIPLLLLFGSLFASADPVFGNGLRRLTQVDFGRWLGHAVATGFWAWISAGFAWRVLRPADFGSWTNWRPEAPVRSPHIEILTVLALLSVLFLAFVGVQIPYLFGDDILVRNTPGLTFAEYARRGFFELLAVAVLLLPLLRLADWLLGDGKGIRIFRRLAGLLLGLLGVILVSAVKRMGLYVEAYGWTGDRLYALAMLAWLAWAAGFLAATLLPGRRPYFAGGAVAGALAILLGLHLLNPDDFVARHNLARAAKGHPFDHRHAARLGPDAVPALLRGLSTLPAEDREALREALNRRWGGTDALDWRLWNGSRAQARQWVRNRMPDAD